MTDVITTIVCTTAVAINIRELSRRLGKIDLDGMFLTALSATGKLPATHYISSGLIRPAYLSSFSSSTQLFNVAKAAWEADGNVFPFSQTQITAALSSCTVSDGTTTVLIDGVNTVVDEGPHALIARLGLKIIQAAA